MGAITAPELKRFVMLKADEIIVNVVARRNLFAVVADLIGERVERVVVLEAVGAIAEILPIACLCADVVMDCVGEASFIQNVDHIVISMGFAKTRRDRSRDVVGGLLDAPHRLAAPAPDIHHAVFAMILAEPRLVRTREVEVCTRDTRNYLAALAPDIDHMICTMTAAEPRPARTRDVIGGLLGASNDLAALAHDIHHVVFTMIAAEPRFARPRDVVCWLFDAPHPLTEFVLDIDHAVCTMNTAEPRRPRARDIEGRTRAAANDLAVRGHGFLFVFCLFFIYF